MRAYLALLLALPMTALAQTTTATAGQVIITENNDTDGVINNGDCKDPSAHGLNFNWLLASGLTLSSGSTVTLTVSTTATAASTACPTGTNIWSVSAPVNTDGTGQYPSSTDFANLTSILTPLGFASCSQTSLTLYACVSATVTAGTTTTYTATGSIVFDQTLPPAPTITSVVPGDGALEVTFTGGATTTTAPATAFSYHATATPHAGGTPTTTTEFTGTSIRIEGLTNGTPYDVTVSATSQYGNVGAPSASSPGTPQVVLNFWRLYGNAGGREEGGCASGPAGVFALLVPIFFALRRRRS
jgi:hypothetical protein